MKTLSASLRLSGLILFIAFSAAAQVPAPKDVLGFTPGDDRKLASWSKVVEYFQKLDKASDRIVFQEIGKTTMGAPFVYATISAPENLRNLEKYKQINAKLADPRKFGTRTPPSASSAAVKELVNQGKTIVMITCGIHSTEVGSYLSSMLIAYRLANSDDPEVKKILSNTIILLVPSLNPDGVDIVKNWYDKTLGTPYEGTEPPELYHKYVGHDDNRDWYAFTQVETQLTVDKIHNVWHPQIVHDIHQQGANGSRLFLPPYMQPVEPNVPKQIVEGYTELGNYMAKTLREKGFQGITTNSTYDAWTPARAYSHYHGGVRILSETASCRLATPITVNFDDVRGGLGYDAKVESANFGPIWRGGAWGLRDITNYMTTTAFTLLGHAADNRNEWLSRFYEIGKEAVRPRKTGELTAFVLPSRKAGSGSSSEEDYRRQDLLSILDRAGVEVQNVRGFSFNGQSFEDSSAVVPMDQPYGAFAKAVLERQAYPNLLDKNGSPIQPYDVTAHTLSLLMDVPVVPINVSVKTKLIESRGFGRGCGNGGHGEPGYGIYRSAMGVMDEGWTRWVFEQREKALCDADYRSVTDKDIRSGQLPPRSIVFPDQSAAQMFNGYRKGTRPDELTGGIGKEGVENLKKYVEGGGTLVFLNRSSDFAIEQFKLPIKDVTRGLPRKDFFIPGSILRTELDTGSPIAKGMPKGSIAWFENSPAFEVIAPVGSPTVREGSSQPPGALTNVRATDIRATDTPFIHIIARYPSEPKDILLSGWALGADKIAGKAALVEVKMGKGRIILFGFRPQYRGQSSATYPLMFNAISGN